MLKNYLQVALRNLFKNKSYVIINTFGLGIALACCITAYMLVAYNIEFDSFHPEEKVRNIFRIHTHLVMSDGNKTQTTGSPILVGPLASEEISGINKYTRFAAGSANVSFDNKAFGEQVAFADSTFFELFDFPLISGNHQSFRDLHSIFITKELSEKYFGDENPIGKILTLSFARGMEKKFLVGGVLKDVPINSSLLFPAIIRIEHFAEMRLQEQQPWQDWNLPSTFVELSNPDKAEELAPLLGKYIALRNEAVKDQEVTKFSLEPFKKPVDMAGMTYAYRPYVNSKIDTDTLIIFISMAVMILLIACFNLTNTSIAMTGTRLKEIGVRKSVGAYKSQIVMQFMLETALIMLLSVLVGYMMSVLIINEFTTMWNFPYGLSDMSHFNLTLMLLFILVLASVLAGIYPALFNSKFNAVTLLKGNVKIKGTNGLTRILVTLQFAISVIALIAGVVFTQNARYQEQVRFGYDQEQLLTISIQSEKEFYAMEAKAMGHPKIKGIAVTDHQVGMSTYQSPVHYENVDFNVKHVGAGKNYFKIMGFKFVQGRPFDHDKANDVAEAAVVSQELVKFLNIQGDPIGQMITVHGHKRRIVGVIDNFLDNLYQSSDPEPFVFYPSIETYWKQMIVKADAPDLAEVNSFLEKSWKELYPTQPYNSMYQEDILFQGTRQLNGNMTKMFLFLTILGGILSISGIFSLASLNIARRTKEIGIRKVLGGTVSNVLMLLNREFIVILLVAGLLGSIGGYFGTNVLMDQFYAFYKPAGIFTIVGCSILLFAVGIATTSLTILRVARANPVDTLRDE